MYRTILLTTSVTFYVNHVKRFPPAAERLSAGVQVTVANAGSDVFQKKGQRFGDVGDGGVLQDQGAVHLRDNKVEGGCTD